MFISDLILGIHLTMIYVYLSFFLIILIGRLLKGNYYMKKLLLASISSSILFFIITNFGVWLSFNLYSKDLAGLINCYQMAIPFFRNTVLSDLFYSFSFFYGYDFLTMLTKKIVVRALIKPRRFDIGR